MHIHPTTSHMEEEIYILCSSGGMETPAAFLAWTSASLELQPFPCPPSMLAWLTIQTQSF